MNAIARQRLRNLFEGDADAQQCLIEAERQVMEQLGALELNAVIWLLSLNLGVACRAMRASTKVLDSVTDAIEAMPAPDSPESA